MHQRPDARDSAPPKCRRERMGVRPRGGGAHPRLPARPDTQREHWERAQNEVRAGVLGRARSARQVGGLPARVVASGMCIPRRAVFTRIVKLCLLKTIEFKKRTEQRYRILAQLDRCSMCLLEGRRTNLCLALFCKSEHACIWCDLLGRAALRVPTLRKCDFRDPATTPNRRDQKFKCTI